MKNTFEIIPYILCWKIVRYIYKFKNNPNDGIGLLFILYSLKLYREEVLNTHLVTSFGRSLSWGQLNYYRLCMHEEKSWKNILNNECMRKTETLKEKDILTKESKYSLSTNFQWNGKTHFTGWCVTLWGNVMNNNNTHCMSSFLCV